LGQEKCTPTETSARPGPEKILATRKRKGPPPYVGMPPPEWLIRPWSLFTAAVVANVRGRNVGEPQYVMDVVSVQLSAR